MALVANLTQGDVKDSQKGVCNGILLVSNGMSHSEKDCLPLALTACALITVCIVLDHRRLLFHLPDHGPECLIAALLVSLLTDVALKADGCVNTYELRVEQAFIVRRISSTSDADFHQAVFGLRTSGWLTSSGVYSKPH